MRRKTKAKRSKNQKGSLTIEISFLMPFIVFLIWNVVYLAFYLYNQGATLQGSYQTALRIERYAGSEAEKNALAEEKYQDAVKTRIVCAESTKQIEISEKEVVVETRIQMRTPGKGFFHNVWQGGQRQQAEEWKPVRFIRTCRSAENIWNNFQNNNGGG